MKKSMIAALALSTMLVSPTIVLAEDAAAAASSATAPAADSTPSAKATKADYEKLLKLSDDGYKALRDIRTARVDIFNGNTADAGKQIDAAMASAKKAQSLSANFVGKTNATDSQDWIPVDATMDVADNYVDSDAKKKHIAKANELLRQNKKREAVEELKLADIDVNFTRLMMPMTATEKHIATAKTLIGEKKYYEANLALKAAEDGLVIDSVSLVDVPVKKGAANAKTASTPAATSAKATDAKTKDSK